jgi:hypothetical protein
MPIDNNPTLKAAVGSDFYKKRFTVINQDTVFGNMNNINSTAEDWKNQLAGLELFLLTKVEHQELELAAENNSNHKSNNNSFVVQHTNINGDTYKYFLDKETFLIKKVFLSLKNKPRTGGGIIEVTNTYEDYKNFDGLMLPQNVIIGNYMNHNLIEAKIQPIDSKVFSNIEADKLYNE